MLSSRDRTISREREKFSLAAPSVNNLHQNRKMLEQIYY